MGVQVHAARQCRSEGLDAGGKVFFGAQPSAHASICRTVRDSENCATSCCANWHRVSTIDKSQPIRTELPQCFTHPFRRYYVIEVKVRKFDPADVGQIGTYMVAVNRQLKQPSDQQPVGLIICREKDRVTVQYALESSALPIGVSDYVLERFIPADFKSQMPTIEEVEGELTRRMEIAEVRKSVKCSGQDDVSL